MRLLAPLLSGRGLLLPSGSFLAGCSGGSLSSRDPGVRLPHSLKQCFGGSGTALHLPEMVFENADAVDFRQALPVCADAAEQHIEPRQSGNVRVVPRVFGQDGQGLPVQHVRPARRLLGRLAVLLRPPGLFAAVLVEPHAKVIGDPNVQEGAGGIEDPVEVVGADIQGRFMDGRGVSILGRG